ncbi:MAG: cadmium-translocating P-type ATPase [Oscillospiraceae bacterium]|nr:cadmium-translocating P-type ATPase [Oscillospiraceae bacterium]
MKKVYIIENLDCANCAAKIEGKFNAHPQVQEATITFATRQLRLAAEDPDTLIPELVEIARTVEGEVTIHPRETVHEHDHDCGCGHEHHHDHDCGCGHDHHHEHDHECHCGHHHGHETSHDEAHHSHDHGEEQDESPIPLLVGAGLFVAGLILNNLGLKWLTLAVCLVAYVILGRELVMTAVRNLTKGHVFDENFLMSIATIGAFFIGEFPEAVGVMLFYRVGEYFEHKAVERSRSQIMKAVDLRPEVVNLVEKDGIRVIPAEDAQVGHLLLVRPGDRIPLDGVVITGESRIDTAPITGEPVPVHVAEGDSVTSGCVNTTGQLTIRVERPLSESMVTRILDSVENAAASKPKIDRFITRFARVYTPVVVAVAAATAILPSLVTGDWGYWVYTALTFLVMSCPCALVLSVPLAFFAGIGAGSKKGILFKGGQSMEALGSVKAVVMDKTGTITKGDFRVQEVAGGHDVLKLCASCEQQSTHPIAQSIVACAKERNMELFQPDSLEEIPGRGIRAGVDGQTILCGNERLMAENGIAMDQIGEVYGTKVLVAVDSRFVGYIVIADTIKDGAKAAVEQLKTRGIATVMLTGDAEDSAKAVAAEVGIDELHAGLLPHQKLEQLQAIRASKGAAMFVGDGINDAPVLAGADVGAAMGSGADAAIEAADVVFMTSDVGAVPEALRIAKETAGIAWQNVIFALTVKAIVMVLGLFGHASMWLAVFADSGVAMLCVLNSIRVLYKKK